MGSFYQVSTVRSLSSRWHVTGSRNISYKITPAISMHRNSTTKSSMKTCVFTPTHETGILVAHIIPYAGSHDTRLGRESAWPLAPSGTHFFQAAEGQGTFLRP